MAYWAHRISLGCTNYQQATELSAVQDMTQNFADVLKKSHLKNRYEKKRIKKLFR
jgi:hypothetical protein